MIQSAPSTLLFVNPTSGNNTSPGSQTAPFLTLTKALQVATTGTVIQLAAGTYSADRGEIFPLTIPSGVTVLGREDVQGQGVILQGSGSYDSNISGQLTIGLRLVNEAQLRGVTVINPAPDGVGVLVEVGAPTIAQCTLTTCNRAGLIATGNSYPLILSNIVTNNTDSGLIFLRSAKGEIRRNLLRSNGFGIALYDDVAPHLIENQLDQNRWGVYVANLAKPVLRGNLIQQNTEGGLVVLNAAKPDLGIMGDGGNNTLTGNLGTVDLTNATGQGLVAAGNQVTADRIRGEVTLTATMLSPPAIISNPTPPPIDPSPPSPNPPQPSDFTDTAAHWAKAFIDALVARSILRGFPNGTFQPEQPITRAQFAATIAQFATIITIGPKRQPQVYSDVPSNFWAAQVIQQADQQGFMAGFPDGTFRPNLNLTRVQAMVAIVSGLGLRGGGPSDLGNYRDRAQIPSYALDTIATATQRRLVINYPRLDYLNPLRNITRAEVAALIYQGLVTLNVAPAIASQFIVEPSAITTRFSDLQGHWAEAFVSALEQQRMIGGFPDGRFLPDAPMTRVQYCGLLVNAFNPAPKRAAIPFQDVPTSFWGYDIIQRAYRGGFISGFTDGTFKPDATISRLQVLLSLAYGLLPLTTGDVTLLNRYLDRTQIPDYARSSIAAATANQLVINQPVPQWLNPNLPATRAEVTANVYQGLVLTRRLPTINSPFIIKP